MSLKGQDSKDAPILFRQKTTQTFLFFFTPTVADKLLWQQNANVSTVTTVC
jgi:hypothetical protein